jgi:hypothetical protein
MDSIEKQWTPLKKFIFFFFFIFFICEFFLSPNLFVTLFGFNIKIADWFDSKYYPLNIWLNDKLFHFPFDKDKYFPAAVPEFIQHIFFLFIALLGSFIWLFIDRKRRTYNQLSYWFNTVMLYVLSIITFAYGIDKLIPVQMPTPNLYSLNTKLGNHIPVNVLWGLMGAGKSYQMFSGLMEVVGAVLLLRKKSAVLGLLILLGVYSNVIMMNYAFFIGVIYFAIILFSLSLYLLWPYTKKLWNFFWKNQEENLSSNAILIAKSLKYKFILLPLLLLTLISYSFNTYNALKSFKEKSIREKTTLIYKVDTFIANSDTVKAIENDNQRWQYWVEYENEGKKYLSIMPMNMSKANKYNILQDTLNGKIALSKTSKSENNEPPVILNYTRISDRAFTVNGNYAGQEIKVSLTKFYIDSLPLLIRKPNLLPYNTTNENNK